MHNEIRDEDLCRLSDFVAETMGLDFPPSRWPDLRRGIAAAARQMRMQNSAQCLREILDEPNAEIRLNTLAGILTVGETYFFRDMRTFEVLEEQILPQLLKARRDRAPYLRIWSAACCTGEEAYSIAILLRRMIPDLERWNITILATDINPRFLRQAAAGIFGRWSFRDTPDWLRKRYFRPLSDSQFEILPEIRRMVRFARLNLADDVYPSPDNDTIAMDLIFCRNVLMYFTPAQAQKVVQRLCRAQANGGWLVVGPTELHETNCLPLTAVNFRGKSFYRRGEGELPVEKLPAPVEPAPIRIDAPPVRGRAALFTAPALAAAEPPAPPAVQARSLANQGKLAEALDCCQRWITADQFNSAGHYLRAVILEAQGATDAAVQALRAALYLDPNFVLAHFELGSISRRRGVIKEALKHLQIARRLLGEYQPNDVLPESDGVTAGRFIRIVDSLLEKEAA